MRKIKPLYKEIGGVFEDYIGTLIKDYGIESISSAKILSEITYVVGRMDGRVLIGFSFG